MYRLCVDIYAKNYTQSALLFQSLPFRWCGLRVVCFLIQAEWHCYLSLRNDGVSGTCHHFDPTIACILAMPVMSLKQMEVLKNCEVF